MLEAPTPEREGWFGIPSSVPDVNGDGRSDLLVAEPEAGKISVYLQKADGALASPPPD